jgi:Peptidase family S41
MAARDHRVWGARMVRSPAKAAKRPSTKRRDRARRPQRRATPGAKAKSQRRPAPTVEVRLSEAIKANLGDIETLATFLSSAGGLDRKDRLGIVDQALVMIDQTYVHLPLKRAMHAIDPVQRLRLVRQRLDSYTERAFHNEMISIFVHLRDLHTNYILPEPYRSRVAFLPFHIEECFEPVGPRNALVSRYLVTEVAGKLSDPDFKPGVVVTHWSGIPIDTAVQINAEREAGSNLDARHLQGLQTMTNRWMGMSLPPDEEWVTVRYLPDAGNGAVRESRFDWQVFEPPPAPGGGGGSVPGVDRLSAGDDHLLRIGIDAKAEMQRRVRKLLFAPQAVAAQKKMTDLGADAPMAARAFHNQVMAAATTAGALAPELGAEPRRRTANAAAKVSSGSASRLRPGSAAAASALAAGAKLQGVDLTANSIMPDVIKQFGKITRPDGAFGYIRIVTFAIAGQEIEAFIREVIRIAALLPQEGLILDVRGNGGGTIAAGEGLLQIMTPVKIEPERFHLINTPLTLQMCQQGGDLAMWKESAEESVEIGSTFTQGFPLTPPQFCNAIGQTYQGPVVLIVDAGCYSTTDMFAAGFQDHNIGRVLGTSGHTGAGGANVWEHADLEQALPPAISPFKPVPAGASFRVAIRRSMRVGLHSGEPLEDLGVVPDEVYQMTRNDVLNHNGDLIAHACGILAGTPRQRLTATYNKRGGGSLHMTVVTSNVQRVDVLLDGRPVHSLGCDGRFDVLRRCRPSPDCRRDERSKRAGVPGFSRGATRS